MGRHIAVVTPVLDDWESFAALVTEVSSRFTGADLRIDILAVDDGSSTAFDARRLVLPPETCIAKVEILHLAVNLGHQRAIAVGLCAVAQPGMARLVAKRTTATPTMPAIDAPATSAAASRMRTKIASV